MEFHSVKILSQSITNSILRLRSGTKSPTEQINKSPICKKMKTPQLTLQGILPKTQKPFF
jgi:hypothetical protein